MDVEQVVSHCNSLLSLHYRHYTMSISFRSFVHPLEIPRQDATVQELLDVEAGEEWIYGQHGVGLYEGSV
jgi:hypothetical protein